MTTTELESLDIIRPPPRGQCPPPIRMWARGRTPNRAEPRPRLGKTWADVPGARKAAASWRPGRVRVHMDNIGPPAPSGSIWLWVLALVGLAWVGFVLWALWRGVT